MKSSPPWHAGFTAGLIVLCLACCAACQGADEAKAKPSDGAQSAPGATPNSPPPGPSAAAAAASNSASVAPSTSTPPPVSAPPSAGNAPPSTEGSCSELRQRFYAYQEAHAACSRDEQCTCVVRPDVTGSLVGIRATEEPALRSLAAAYSNKGCPVGGRSTRAPVCKAHCAQSTCAP